MPTALITGSTSGLGLALARELKERGWTVLTSGRAAAPAGFDAHFSLDLTAPGAAEALFREATAFRGIDLLVCNAGVGQMGDFAQADPEKLEALMELNMLALTRLNRLFLPYFAARGAGAEGLAPGVLNIASTGAWTPGPRCAAYYASKAYVYSLSRALAREEHPHGVRVAVACPGALKTAFSPRAGRENPARAMAPEKAARLILRGFFRGRSVLVPGFSNKVLHLATHILPASVLVPFLARYQSNLLK